MIRYSCAIGMIGHVDAGERADLAREHAAGVDHDLGLDRAPVGHDARHLGRARRVIPVTRVLVLISAPRRRAPSASAKVSWLGSM